MRKLLGISAVVVWVCLCLAAPAYTDDDEGKSLKEYQVKVAFLYNFIKFVQWPGTQALGLTHTAHICIAGDDPFGSTLNIFKQASTADLSIKVERNIADSAIPGCHILFVSRSEEERLPSLLSIARSHPILTVSEIKGFANNGGIVEMAKTQESVGLFSKNKINLRINARLAEEVGLRIDAQLLEIASEVIK